MFRFLTSVLIIGLVVSSVLMAQEPRTGALREIFLDLPDSVFFQGAKGPDEFRLPLPQTARAQLLDTDVGSNSSAGIRYRLMIFDPKHGYLEIATETDVMGYTIALTYWNRPNQPRMVGVVNTLWEPLDTESRVRFVERNGAGWKDITKDVFPSISLNDFLTKPVNRLELKTRIRSLLRVRHLTSERDRLLAYLNEVDAPIPETQ